MCETSYFEVLLYLFGDSDVPLEDSFNTSHVNHATLVQAEINLIKILNL